MPIIWRKTQLVHLLESKNLHHTVIEVAIEYRSIIDLDIEVDPKLTVLQAHNIAMKVEKKICEKIPEVYDIMVHVEPEGNVEEDEKYGLDNN